MIEHGNLGLAEFLSAPAWRDWLIEIEDYNLFVEDLRWIGLSIAVGCRLLQMF